MNQCYKIWVSIKCILDVCLVCLIEGRDVVPSCKQKITATTVPNYLPEPKVIQFKRQRSRVELS